MTGGSNSLWGKSLEEYPKIYYATSESLKIVRHHLYWLHSWTQLSWLRSCKTKLKSSSAAYIEWANGSCAFLTEKLPLYRNSKKAMRASQRKLKNSELQQPIWPTKYGQYDIHWELLTCQQNIVYAHTSSEAGYDLGCGNFSVFVYGMSKNVFHISKWCESWKQKPNIVFLKLRCTCGPQCENCFGVREASLSFGCCFCRYKIEFYCITDLHNEHVQRQRILVLEFRKPRKVPWIFTKYSVQRRTFPESNRFHGVSRIMVGPYWQSTMFYEYGSNIEFHHLGHCTVDSRAESKGWNANSWTSCGHFPCGDAPICSNDGFRSLDASPEDSKGTSDCCLEAREKMS